MAALADGAAAERPDVARWVQRAVEIPAAIAVLGEVVILLAGVTARYVFNHPLIWSDELASIVFLWLAMLGTAVQTHLVAGQENGLVTIDTAKLYEVQGYCAMTNHIWDGFCLLGNPAAFRRLPAKWQDLVKQEVARAVTEQREDETKLDGTLRDALGAKGMQFRDVDAAAFREALRRTSFYRDWGQKFGKPGWDALQSVVGPLG